MVCTGSYALKQIDIDAGKVDNTATADSALTGPVTANNTEMIELVPDLSITKSGTLDTGVDGKATPGDTIGYVITVKNVGNQTLTGVSASDPKLGTLSCAPAQPGTLAPNASLICTGSYAITQIDIDAGLVLNTATADSAQTDPESAENTETIPQAPSLGIAKIGDLDVGADGRATPGDTIFYTITASNNGNQTLDGVSITDPKVGTLVCAPAQPGTLAPNDSMSCTGSYVITQADIDAGKVDNTATADSDQTPATSATNTENITQVPILAIDKIGDLDIGADGRATVGDKIFYTITVSNNGNQTLDGIVVNDALLPSLSCSPATSTLAPGASFTCHGSYAITQADIDAGVVDNTATADSGQTTPVSDLHTVEIQRKPGLNILKEGDLDLGADGIAGVDDAIAYTITVSNDGNQTLTGVGVTDPLLPTLVCTPAQPATLAPDTSMICTGSHTLTQADIDAGKVENTATADSTQTEPKTDSHTVSVPQTPVLSISKSGALDLGSDSTATPDDVINYTLVVKNEGNQTLTGLSISDPLLSNLACALSVTTLAPGASVTCTGSHLLTQTDIDLGEVHNTATADSTQTLPKTASAKVEVPQAPSLGLDKEGVLDDGSDNVATPGDTITYKITVSNNGNTTLTDVTVSDPKAAPLQCPVTLPTTLAPGASFECTGSYAITQADIDAGAVDNTATADSTETSPEVRKVTVDIPQQPLLSITKSGALGLGSDDRATPGDKINYVITVKNEGNQTLTAVTASDPKLGTLSCTPVQPATLAPNDSLVCTGSYAITQADIDAGAVDNTATASSAQTPEKPASAQVDVPQVTTISIDKLGDLNLGANGRANPGDAIAYTIDVLNTGNRTLTNVSVGDSLLTNMICTPSAPATLAPNASMQCTGSYVIDQDDIDAGEVLNTATVNSAQTDPKAANNTESIPKINDMTLVKTGTLDTGDDGIATPGDLIKYTLVAENTGNTTLHTVSIADPKLGALLCTPTQPATLLPGDKLICEGSYAITQTDIDNGIVTNEAIGDSDETDPTPGSTDEKIPQAPGLQIVKSGLLNAGSDNRATPGDVIDYTVTATNSGNQTLTGVIVSDPKLGTLSCAPVQPATLAPTGSIVCTGSYAITQSDIDAGVVKNTATADSAQTDKVDGENIEDIVREPGINIVKDGVLDKGVDGIATPGDKINYQITVSNNGNQTLDDVTVTDPLLSDLAVCQRRRRHLRRMARLSAPAATQLIKAILMPARCSTPQPPTAYRPLPGPRTRTWLFRRRRLSASTKKASSTRALTASPHPATRSTTRSRPVTMATRH